MPGTSQNSYDLSLRKCLTAGRIFGPSTELCRPLPVTTSTFQVPENRGHRQFFRYWHTHIENSCFVILSRACCMAAAWQTSLQCKRHIEHQHACADTLYYAILYKFSTEEPSLQKLVVLTFEPGQVLDCLLHLCHSLIHVQCMQVHLECVAHLCVPAKGATLPHLLCNSASHHR